MRPLYGKSQSLLHLSSPYIINIRAPHIKHAYLARLRGLLLMMSSRLFLGRARTAFIQFSPHRLTTLLAHLP